MPVIKANGESIYFEDVGDGPPVLFFHSLGTNSYLFRDQIAVLKNSYRCIAPDCRGHGNSSCNGSLTLKDFISDHKAVLDHLDIKRCHIIGLSMGGLILLHFNSKWPDIGISFIIADSYARTPAGVEDHICATREAVAYLSMHEFGSQYAGDRLMPTTPIEKLDELAFEISKCPSEAYVDTLQTVLTYDGRADLSNIKRPTLIIIGDSDDVTPMSESEYIRDSIYTSSIIEIPNAGHLSNIDNPKKFNETVKIFLDSQSKEYNEGS